MGRAAVLRVEGAAQAQHLFQIGRREEFGHEVKLFDADAMLAGHAAAAVNALLEDLVTGRQHSADLVRIAFVEEKTGMNVAVAGVEYVADADLIFLADVIDEAQNIR